MFRRLKPVCQFQKLLLLRYLPRHILMEGAAVRGADQLVGEPFGVASTPRLRHKRLLCYLSQSATGGRGDLALAWVFATKAAKRAADGVRITLRSTGHLWLALVLAACYTRRQAGTPRKSVITRKGTPSTILRPPQKKKKLGHTQKQISNPSAPPPAKKKKNNKKKLLKPLSRSERVMTGEPKKSLGRTPPAMAPRSTSETERAFSYS